MHSEPSKYDDGRYSRPSDMMMTNPAYSGTLHVNTGSREGDDDYSTRPSGVLLHENPAYAGTVNLNDATHDQSAENDGDQ